MNNSPGFENPQRTPLVDHTLPNKAHGTTPKTHAPPSKREMLHSLMAQTAGNKYGWYYREVRPLSPTHPLSHGLIADCSYALVDLCFGAGVPDPTGCDFRGYGNSTSIFHHLNHITLAEAKIGDILLFGPNGDWHATMIFAPHPTNPMLWSHGHQGAPNLYPLSADHRAPVTVCRIAAP